MFVAAAGILPMKQIADSIKGTSRPAHLASIAEVDIVEPLAAGTRRDATAPYLLVDGNLRCAALLDVKRSEARCLIADDDEAFTYNKRAPAWPRSRSTI
jgi:hypothetical protein